MKVSIYLNKVEPVWHVATVELEVVPRGIYEIDGIVYHLTGQPKFYITKSGRYAGCDHDLVEVELIVSRTAPSPVSTL
jgi:hypothetical protein